jgi:hypothetical protein
MSPTEDPTETSGKTEVHFEVAAPNNVTEQFRAPLDQLITVLARDAVESFADAGQMASHECGLALITDGQAERLADTATLREAGIRDGVLLKLIVKKPKTDG